MSYSIFLWNTARHGTPKTSQQADALLENWLSRLNLPLTYKSSHSCRA